MLSKLAPQTAAPVRSPNRPALPETVQASHDPAPAPLLIDRADISTTPVKRAADRLMQVLAAGCGWLAAASMVGGPWVWAAGRDTSTRVGEGFQWFCRGSAEDAAGTTRPGLFLAGGGDDLDDGFRWFLDHCGGGDVVVLRAAGGDDYNEYIDGLGKADSVETILVSDARGASDPFVVDRVKKAEAVFFAGGDQWDYVSMWKGTPLGEALQAHADRGTPMGGTSAGLAILGQHVFTAEHDTITSEEALADPHDARITLDHHFLTLPNMKDVVTDTHFVARDRMGRLMAFMSRTLEDGAPKVRGIAVDEATAVLVEADGRARVTGNGTAYFLEARAIPSAHSTTGPLDFHDVQVDRVAPGGTFDLSNWQGNSEHYRLDVDKGVLRSSRPDGSVY